MIARRFLLVSLIAGLGACSTVPEAIRNAPPEDPPLSAVVSGHDPPHNARVRWGGTIVALENAGDGAWIEVLARPLRGNGKPMVRRESPGRFLARVDRVLDPAIYASGRRITVVGAVTGGRERPIAGRFLRLPVIIADAHHLWPQSPSQRDYRGPYFHGSDRYFFGEGLIPSLQHLYEPRR